MRNNKQSVVQAVVVSTYVSIYEADTHDGLVAAATPSFLKHQQQTENTPFTTPLLLNEIGCLVNGSAVDSIIDVRYIPPQGTDACACEFLSALEMPGLIC